MAIDPEKTYDLSELAQELGVSVRTVQRRARSGAVKASRRGRRYLVSGKDAIAYERETHLAKLGLAAIEARYRAKVSSLVRELLEPAVEMLEHDIRDPVLTGEHSDPNDFMLRGNCVGLALFRPDCWSLADTTYCILLDKTLKFRKSKRQRRHAGALWANRGVAQWGQGNVDGAILSWLKAAEEDGQTYGVEPKASYALVGLYERHVGRPVKQFVLQTVRLLNPSVTTANVVALCDALRAADVELAFMGYLTIAQAHLGMLSTSPNVFSSLQILSALRNLSCLFEVHIGRLGGEARGSLHAKLEQLYEKKTWWKRFEEKRKSVRAIGKSRASSDQQLRSTLAMAPTTEAERFWQSLLVACIVRNYTAHAMDPSCDLAVKYSRQALSHSLHAMVMAAQWK